MAEFSPLAWFMEYFRQENKKIVPWKRSKETHNGFY
jgi:hypothetical protein